MARRRLFHHTLVHMSLPARDVYPSSMSEKLANPPPASSALRFAPLLLVAAGMACALYFRPDKSFSPEQILARKEELTGFAMQHLALAAALFVAVYALCVALSVPGAAFLTLAGGFLFGPWLGGSLAVLAATTGAVAVFLVAESSLGNLLRARAGPWLEKFRAGFEADAGSYLLFLRLAPVFPFWLVNIAPAFLGVRLVTFAWTTFLGIIPGTFVFALAGASLDMVVEDHARIYQACLSSGAAGCRLKLSLGSLLSPAILAAMTALALLSLAPVLVKRWHMRKKAGTGGNIR